MASARSTLGNLLGVINNTATTAIGVVNAASMGVGMMEVSIAQAATAQKVRVALNTASMVKRVSEERAQEDAERKITIDQFRGRSEKHAEYYDEALASYSAVIAGLDLSR